MNQQFRGQASYAIAFLFYESLSPIQPLNYNDAPTAPLAQANNFGDNRGVRTGQERAKFDPILVSYTELLLRLLQNQLVTRVLMEPHKP